MAPTRTVKNKHAGGGKSKDGGGGGKRSSSDGIRKPSSSSKSKTPVPTSQVKGRPNLKGLDKKKKKKVYSEKELGIPELNMITPVGVTKPKGKKKGKVFVDDRVCSFLSVPRSYPSVIYQHKMLIAMKKHRKA